MNCREDIFTLKCRREREGDRGRERRRKREGEERREEESTCSPGVAHVPKERGCGERKGLRLLHRGEMGDSA